MSLYAVGDIHGQSAELDRALRLIASDGGEDAEIVFLGDYTDRGPDSRGVLDRLVAGKAQGRPWRFCMGNHDRMFLRFLSEGRENDSRIGSGKSWLNRALGGAATLGSYGLSGEARAFLYNGGVETLASYRVEGEFLNKEELAKAAYGAVPEAHRRFLEELDLWHEFGDLLFVHAGLRPGRSLRRQREDDLIWIRDGWLDSTADHGWLVVHGHTALDHPQHHGNRVNLDGGAGYGRPLVPAVFEGRKVWLIDEGGRSLLEPAPAR